MRVFLLRSLFLIQESFIVTVSPYCLMAGILHSTLKSVYWQQKDVSVTKHSITGTLTDRGESGVQP